MHKTLQIPVKEDLRDRAVKVAEEQGFSSLQEAVRIFLGQFAARKISVTFTHLETLSPKNERRYGRMIDDVKTGKTKTKQFRDTVSLIGNLQR